MISLQISVINLRLGWHVDDSLQILVRHERVLAINTWIVHQMRLLSYLKVTQVYVQIVLVDVFIEKLMF